MIELKPCPFCGGEADMVQSGTSRQSCIVECSSCGARRESGDEGENSGRLWNERVIEAALAAAPQGEPVAFHELLREAEAEVRAKPVWKRYIDGTPLANDVPVWMAVFAQHHARTAAPPAPAAQPSATGVADLRDAKWLDPECADRGACQSLRFKAAQPSADPWRNAVEQMLATTEQTASDDPRESINRLINWHVSVAMDPLVSSDARALIQRGRDEAQSSAEPSELVRAARTVVAEWREPNVLRAMDDAIDALRHALDAGRSSYIVETSADGAGWHTVSTHASADAAIAAMHDVAGRLPGRQTARVRVEGDASEAKGGGR